MKRIFVACGSGVATSQTVASKIQSMCEDEGLDVSVEAVDIKYLRTAEVLLNVAEAKFKSGAEPDALIPSEAFRPDWAKAWFEWFTNGYQGYPELLL